MPRPIWLASRLKSLLPVRTRHTGGTVGAQPCLPVAPIAEQVTRAASTPATAGWTRWFPMLAAMLLAAGIAGWPLGYAPALVVLGINALRYASAGRRTAGRTARAQVHVALLLIVAWTQWHWLAALLLADIVRKMPGLRMSKDEREEARAPISPLFPYPLF